MTPTPTFHDPKGSDPLRPSVSSCSKSRKREDSLLPRPHTYVIETVLNKPRQGSSCLSLQDSLSLLPLYTSSVILIDVLEYVHFNDDRHRQFGDLITTTFSSQVHFKILFCRSFWLTKHFEEPKCLFVLVSLPFCE